MRKTPLVLLTALLLLAGLIVLLSTRAQEVPTRTIETPVNSGGDAR